MPSIDDKSALDLGRYDMMAEDHDYVRDLKGLGRNDTMEFAQVGLETGAGLRAGTFIQKDNSILHCSRGMDGVDIMGIAQAEEQFSEVGTLLWSLLDRDKDEIARSVVNAPLQGFFIRVEKGVCAEKPLQTCLHIAKNRFAQNVHNLIVVEEDADIHIIAGCSTAKHLESGLHLGLSEFFIKKGAKLTYTMIHDWGENIEVRPRTAVHVEEGGVFISNYVSLKPVGSLITNPVTILEKDATARFNSILVAGEGSFMDVGSVVDLKGEGARAEIISRAIVAGGTIISRGHLKGRVEGVKGHLECKGIILKEGILHAIPELSGRTPGVEMSHEAAVGKIDKREIEYLMSRGLSEDDAISTIVRGFLNVDIEGLPKELAEKMDKAIQETEQDMM